ncbi:MAG: TAXI family TRAP transporter solute-binding subunit [Clostridia bacterium]|nr:TAXI family TRAP transporter solute-binding subunit [Clostridia bacterium]
MKKVFALVLSLCLVLGASAALADSLIFGTAATSGTYYQVGAAIGAAIQNAGLQVNVIPTAGSNENVALAQSLDIDIGMGNSDAIYGAYHGELTYAEAGPQAIQEVAALYYSQMHIYTKDGSGIESVADMKGKKICVGSQGTSWLYMVWDVLSYYGITEADITPYYMNYAESSEALANGDIDAAFQVGGYPLAGIQQSAATTAFTFLSLPQEVSDSMREKYSYAIQATIPAGTYENQTNTEDAQTLAYMTCLFCGAEADEDAIYDFVTKMIETLPVYQDTNVATRQITLDMIATPFIPLNAGAERAYRDAGVIQ